MQPRSLCQLVALVIAATALAACDALRMARGCGFVQLDSSVTPLILATSPVPVAAEERERRAREAMAARFGLPLEDVAVHERATSPHPASGITAYVFKMYRRDDSYLGPIFVDASGAALSENAISLADTIAGVRQHGKVDADLSDAVARTLPSDAVPVMFQLVAAPWDGPATPWPLGLAGDEWNRFVEQHADRFYRPIVAPFIEDLRSVGARDIAPDLAPGTHVKGAWVFARVPSSEVCTVAHRSDVLRALYNPPVTLR